MLAGASGVRSRMPDVAWALGIYTGLVNNVLELEHSDKADISFIMPPNPAPTVHGSHQGLGWKARACIHDILMLLSYQLDVWL